MLKFYKKHWLASCFSFIKKSKYKFSLNLCSGNQSVIASVCIFDTIAASLSYILIWTSTCGSVRYKRKIQNREIQSKRVLGLMKYTHRLSDHNKLTQQYFFVETAHRKSKGVLILRTISHHNTISCHNTISHHNHKTDTTAQVYCTLSTYVIPKIISCQNQKLTQCHNCFVL